MMRQRRNSRIIVCLTIFVAVLLTGNEFHKLQEWNRKLRTENYVREKTMKEVASGMEKLISGMSYQKEQLLRGLIQKVSLKSPVEEQNTELFLRDSCPSEWEASYSCPGTAKKSFLWPYTKEIHVNQSFECLQKISDITILLNLEGRTSLREFADLIQSIAEAYPFVRMIAGVSTKDEVQIRKMSSDWVDQVRFIGFKSDYANASRWKHILDYVETSMVLIGRNLDYFGKFSNLDRSVNLLEKYQDIVLAIGGSRRLREGKWVNGCSQVKIESYALRMTHGYEKSTCDDCMLCTHLQGPFLTYTQRFREFPLEEGLSLGFYKWFYDHKEERTSLSCPDLLYLTNEEDITKLEGNREEWRSLGESLKFQSVFLDEGHSQSHFNFSCNEIGLKCTPRSSADSFLLPYCCTKSYNTVIEVLDDLSLSLGFDYKLDSGSLLGAVKLSNFIPWDIDGDIYIKTEHSVNFFDEGGRGREAMREVGFVLSGLFDDNYSDKGARYFNIYYGGVTFEMMGRRDLRDSECAEYYRDKVCKNVTRVLVGQTWARAHDNPGKYIRLRYGPGYLRHATSWRYIPGMKDSFGTYSRSGFWNLCRDPGHHYCLSSLLGDGNIPWLPSNYPGN